MREPQPTEAAVIHLESRKVDIAGITVHPNEQWMRQMARNATMEGCGALRACRYLLHDRDTKFTHSFRVMIESGLARGWVGSCAITIKKLRELAGKSRTMPVRLRPGHADARADSLLTKMTTTANSRVATADLRPRTTGQSTDDRRRLGQPQIDFTIEQTKALNQYFDHTRSVSPTRTEGRSRACR